ncbi:hypothetical protein DWU89_08610 [Parabacteroides acidifaciens]|uniref:Uncharacterized protein n=1 Tax=Parabacteroides acidifaciens TaxID=2290935 RepID=A0A3D8HF63_9BACT|nr:hypothetical protein DWU89_08610 [Parabacteroides acidifaciens]
MSFEPEKYVFYNKPPLPQALFCQIMNLFIPNDYRVSPCLSPPHPAIANNSMIKIGFTFFISHGFKKFIFAYT